VHHTTEGTTAEGAIAAYRRTGSWPHFTVEWDGSRLVIYQHVPLSQASFALRHVYVPETNRARAVQIEHVGFARDTASWPEGRYREIAKLCRWIESQTGCPPTASVSFSRPSRLSPDGFVRYSGHCGHMHVPGNDHTDPGVGFRIDLVLTRADSRKLRLWRRRHRIAHARARRVGWPRWLRERARRLHRLIEREEARG
jgi:hypothetical protein